MEARDSPHAILALMTLGPAACIDAFAVAVAEVIVVAVRQADPACAGRAGPDLEIFVDQGRFAVHPQLDPAAVHLGLDDGDAAGAIIVFVAAVLVSPDLDVDPQPSIGAKAECLGLRRIPALLVGVKAVPVIVGDPDVHKVRAFGERDHQLVLFIFLREREVLRQAGIIALRLKVALRVHLQRAGGACNHLGRLLVLHILENLSREHIVSPVPDDALIAEVDTPVLAVYLIIGIVRRTDGDACPYIPQVIRVYVEGRNVNPLTGLIGILEADDDVAIVLGIRYRERRVLAIVVHGPALAHVDIDAVFARLAGGHGQAHQGRALGVHVHPVGGRDPPIVRIDERLAELGAFHGIDLDLDPAIPGHDRVEDAILDLALNRVIDEDQEIYAVAVDPLAVEPGAGIGGIAMRPWLAPVEFRRILVMIAVLAIVPTIVVVVFIVVVIRPLFIHFAVAEIDLDPVVIRAGRPYGVFHIAVQRHIPVALFIRFDGGFKANPLICLRRWNGESNRFGFLPKRAVHIGNHPGLVFTHIAQHIFEPKLLAPCGLHAVVEFKLILIGREGDATAVWHLPYDLILDLLPLLRFRAERPGQREGLHHFKRRALAVIGYHRPAVGNRVVQDQLPDVGIVAAHPEKRGLGRQEPVFAKGIEPKGIPLPVKPNVAQRHGFPIHRFACLGVLLHREFKPICAHNGKIHPVKPAAAHRAGIVNLNRIAIPVEHHVQAQGRRVLPVRQRRAAKQAGAEQRQGQPQAQQLPIAVHHLRTILSSRSFSLENKNSAHPQR